MLTSYMNYQLEGEWPVTKSGKFLRDPTLNFMLAGRDTTGAALTWFFWLVSVRQEVEIKILEELKPISLKSTPESSDKQREILRVFDSEELSQSVYLQAALCESLFHSFPPVPFEHASVLKPEVRPSGETIQLGTKILVPLYTMARMESIWGKDCSEFKPNRWITERGKPRSEPSHKFMEFNTGPRN